MDTVYGRWFSVGRAASLKVLIIPNWGTVPIWMQWGQVGLTCPGWHSHAAGVCQSQVGSPASGTHTVDEGGTPDYPGGHRSRTDSLACGSSTRVPSRPTPVIVPLHHPATTHLELPWVQSSKKGQEETYLTLLFTPIRCPASLPLSPLPVFSAFGIQEWHRNVEYKLWFQTDLCLKSLLWHSPVLSFGENLSFLIYKMAMILPTGWYYITWWSMVTI